MHVVWICHRDLRDFLSFDDKAHMERKKADDHKIEPPSEEHLKDVIKPQEEPRAPCRRSPCPEAHAPHKVDILDLSTREGFSLSTIHGRAVSCDPLICSPAVSAGGSAPIGHGSTPYLSSVHGLQNRLAEPTRC